MGGDSGWGSSPPRVAPLMSGSSSSVVIGRSEEDHSRHFDSSVNATSFGFVATAILISMFLLIAIFERFLRPTSRSTAAHGDLDGKLNYPSPEMTTYARGVSVLMPGDEIPTFIAHPAPAPRPPECISPPLHQHHTLSDLSSSSVTS